MAANLLAEPGRDTLEPANRSMADRLPWGFARSKSMNLADTGFGYEIRQDFPVSRERLYRALTDAASLKRIWGVQQISVDARVGGTTHAVYIADGQDWSFTLTYTEVLPNQSLKWTTRFKSFPTKATRVAIGLSDADGGAELTIQMSNFESAEERDANRRAWEHGLSVLADVVR